MKAWQTFLVISLVFSNGCKTKQSLSSAKSDESSETTSNIKYLEGPPFTCPGYEGELTCKWYESAQKYSCTYEIPSTGELGRGACYESKMGADDLDQKAACEACSDYLIESPKSSAKVKEKDSADKKYCSCLFVCTDTGERIPDVALVSRSVSCSAYAKTQSVKLCGSGNVEKAECEDLAGK